MNRSRGACLAAVIILTSGLTACSDDPEETTPDRSTNAEESTGDGAVATVSFVLFGDPTETAGYETLAGQFEAANDDVDIQLAPVASQDDLAATLTTSFAGGSPPDVFLSNYRGYGQYAQQGVLAPVGPRLAESDVIAEDEFAPASLDAFRYDGSELTCLPQNVSSLEVYYNVDMFEEAGVALPAAGWTWADFLIAAQTLTEDGRYGLGTDANTTRLAPFVWSAGGELVDDEVAPTTFTLDSPEARTGVDFFLDLQNVHGVVPPQAEEEARDSESRFLDGDLGMYLNSRRVVPGLRTIEGFEWDVAPMPAGPSGESVSILHGDAYCMSAASEVQEATWRFIEYANSVEGQTVLAESGRTVPSRVDVAGSDAFLGSGEPPASAQVFVDAIANLRAVPHTGSWSQVEGAADEIIEAMFYGGIDRDEGLQQLLDVTTPLFADPAS